MAKKQSPPSDPKEAESRVRITDFGGMACGLDLHDIDPGESYYQVNVVPFHPGELRVRRGFVVCQFEPSPGAVLVAPPLVRYVEASSSIWIHSDARRGREINVSAWSELIITAEPPVTTFHNVHAFSRVIVSASSSIPGGYNHKMINYTGVYPSPD